MKRKILSVLGVLMAVLMALTALAACEKAPAGAENNGWSGESVSTEQGGEPEQASLAFICKRLKLNLKKLSEEEKKWLKKIAQKSDLLKNPNPQRGRK